MLKVALEADNHDKIKEQMELLEAESHKLAERLYQDQGDAAAPDEEEAVGAGVGAGSEDSSGEDVIDAEFKEEK